MDDGLNMLKDERLVVLAIILLVPAALLIVSNAKPGLATADTNIEDKEIVLVVRPLVIINFSAVPGQSFDVNINITMIGPVNVTGYGLKLSYNPNLINCTMIGEGDLFQGLAATPLNGVIDNTSGDVGVSQNLTSPGATVDNNGTLVALRFQVKGTGETSLHIYDVSLYDSAGLPLTDPAPVVYGGYFNNKFNFDLTMPLTLLAVTFASVLLNLKTENKLKGVLEEREFRVRDAVLLVALMAVMVTLIVIIRQLSAVLMVLFLFSFCLLLYTFGYLVSKNRWYIGILAPAVFILLYIFLRDSLIWTYYLSNIYGLAFAVLITLYLASLFNWTTTAVFGVLITAMDIFLVLVTKTMVQAASAAESLSLPVLVSLPLVPLITTGTGVLILSLGLGDFFFAGLLAIQTFKKYGKRLTIAAVVGMTISFSIFEAFMITFRIGAFPGTLMIICGWVPVVLYRVVRDWGKTASVVSEKVASS